MSGLNRLEITSDLNSPGGRGQLQETLDLITNRIRVLNEDLDKVKDADKIVRPVPIEEYPVAAGQIYTGAEGGEIGEIMWRSATDTPAGFLPCDGSAVSRTTYSDLFAKISTTFGVGDGSTTFNVPDLRGRTAIGTGTGSGLTARSLGANVGAETVQLATSEIPAHSHEFSHTHDISHTHEIDIYGGTVGGGPTKAFGSVDAQTAAAENAVTEAASTSTSGAVQNPPISGPNTANEGGGGSHANMQPSLVLTPYVRFRLGPTDVIQTAPISWGRVNAQWRLDTLKNFPTTGITNVHNVVVTGDRPGAIVQITAASGAQSGNSSENKIVGVLPVPYNFRTWRTTAIRMFTKLTMTGCAGSSSATITLKISDPIQAGAYLGTTYARTVNESSGTIADSDYVEARLTGEELGRDWRPGYLFRFELIWSIPKTFTSATLEVGYLEIGWR